MCTLLFMWEKCETNTFNKISNYYIYIYIYIYIYNIYTTHITHHQYYFPCIYHPPSILLSVPDAINKRLSNISSDKKTFDSAVPPYQEALQKSGYNYKLQCNPQPSTPKRSRSRNVIWFIPPYNSTVSTNIGYKFLQAVDDFFTPHHPLRKIFNRSCMPNVKSINSSHNKSVLKSQSVTSASQADKDCNCRKKNTCPLSGKCLPPP